MSEREYPKTLYASGERSKTVWGPGEEKDLGPGWYESPALVEPGPAPAEPATAEPAAATGFDITRMNAAVVVAAIAAMDKVADIEAVVQVERENPKTKGGRKTVLEVAFERIQQLEAASADAK